MDQYRTSESTRSSKFAGRLKCSLKNLTWVKDWVASSEDAKRQIVKPQMLCS